MAKWVKKKVGYLIKDPYLPPLQRLSKLLTISNNNKKVKNFTENFFSQLALADLSNITGEVLVIYLRVNSDITTKKMAKTISYFLNNTVLELNKILNKALKTYRLLIVL